MDLLERLTKLEAEAAELRKLLTKPAPPRSLLTKPEPRDGSQYWALSFGQYCELVSVEGCACSSEVGFYAHGNLFQSEVIAKAYAEALDTLLLLRHQPGSERACGDRTQYIIRLTGDMGRLRVAGFDDTRLKAEYVTPCFVSQHWADLAIETVGADRILRMFKTLHGVYE